MLERRLDNGAPVVLVEDGRWLIDRVHALTAERDHFRRRSFELNDELQVRADTHDWERVGGLVYDSLPALEPLRCRRCGIAAHGSQVDGAGPWRMMRDVSACPVQLIAERDALLADRDAWKIRVTG